MSCGNSNLFTALFPLTQVFQGAQGPKGDKGDDGASSKTTLSFNSTDAKRALDWEESAGFPAYDLIPFLAAPEAWTKVPVGGGVAVSPTGSSLPTGMTQAVYRRRFIHREVDTSVSPATTKYYSQMEFKGVLEIDSSVGIGGWEAALTFAANATPKERIVFSLPVVDSADRINVQIDTSGVLHVWIPSALGANIHLDLGQLRYEVEYV